MQQQQQPLQYRMIENSPPATTFTSRLRWNNPSDFYVAFSCACTPVLNWPKTVSIRDDHIRMFTSRNERVLRHCCCRVRQREEATTTFSNAQMWYFPPVTSTVVADSFGLLMKWRVRHPWLNCMCALLYGLLFVGHQRGRRERLYTTNFFTLTELISQVQCSLFGSFLLVLFLPTHKIYRFTYADSAAAASVVAAAAAGTRIEENLIPVRLLL